MQKLRLALMAGATLVAASSLAGAQMRGSATIPAAFQPPAGMCRVWYKGVAPGRQPAPTDCATARTRLTSNSFLVYGQGTSQQGNGGWGTRVPGGTGQGNGNGQGGWNDGRNNGRDDGQYDGRDDRRDGRVSDRQRREWEKARRRAEKDREQEWNRAQRQNGRDGDGDDDDDRRDRNRNGDGRNRNGGNGGNDRNRQNTNNGRGGWGTRLP